MRMYRKGSFFRFVVLFVLCGLLLGAGVWTEVRGYQLSDTGQTRCYDNNGAEIFCPAPGEPFFGQDAQYNGAQPTYQDNGNGTVTDLNTGLMWEQDGNVNNGTWNDARYYCLTLTLGGHTWRIPERRELISIVDIGLYEPALNTVFFPEVFSWWYWSNTPFVNPFILNHMWNVDFSDGIVAFRHKSALVDPSYVRCVRGKPLPPGTYIDNGNDTVIDTVTGLVWQKEYRYEPLDWAGALAYCENLTLSGVDDWRLPNIRELESIVDPTRYQNAIDPAFSCCGWLPYYYSSSTLVRDPDSAWGVDFFNGNVESLPKTQSDHFVRCVRGGTESESEIEIYGTVDFGEVEVASAGATHIFRIENQGTAPLHLTGTPLVAIHGTHTDDFTVMSQPDSTVDPGESTTFDILFIPTAEGLREADVIIDNNDRDEDPFNFIVHGSGTIAALDTDSDGIVDEADNCTLVANPSQLDTDTDGFGNACDCDFNQDDFCGGPDFTLFIGCFNVPTNNDPVCAAADMNGDGFIGGPDFTLFIGGFNSPLSP